MRAIATITMLLFPFLLVGAAPRDPSLREKLGWIEQKIVSDDGAASDQFARAVVVRGDVAIVGSPNSTIDGHEGQGAVYVFTRSGGIWSQTQKLVASDGAAGDVFGIAVAMSDDTAIVGAYSSSSYRGSAYVFTLSGGTWSESQKLTTDDAAPFDQFGWSVALDGDIALIGAQGAAIDGNNGQGAVYAFTRSGGTWTQSDKFTSDDGAAADSFGWSVAIDGTNAVVGTGFPTVGGNILQGAAYTFTESGGVWTQTQKLVASNGAAYDFFGLSVAIEGDTILVGADGAATDGDPFSNQGVAYVFMNSGGSWAETQQLTGSDGQPSDAFGEWVAIEGDRALVGATGVSVNGNDGQGAAYLFSRSGAIWSEVLRFVSSDGAENDQFGWEVALSGDTLLMGAYNANVEDRIGQGAAYFYSLPPSDILFQDGFDDA